MAGNHYIGFEESRPLRHVLRLTQPEIELVLTALDKLGFDYLLNDKCSPEDAFIRDSAFQLYDMLVAYCELEGLEV